MIYLSQKIELKPTKKQQIYFTRACGVARFSYNWGISQWRSAREDGETLSSIDLNRILNGLKDELYPWMRSVSSCIPVNAIKNLGIAFSRFFTRTSRAPKFKKKYANDSFRIDNGAGLVGLSLASVKVPRLGKVKLKHAPRFKGKVTNATIRRQAHKWFLCLTFEVCDFKSTPAENQGGVGVDLGVKTMVVCSDGQRFESPELLKKHLKKLKRLQRQASRRQKGSKNCKKANMLIARLHYKIACVRSDTLHKATTSIVRKWQNICIEDLNVSGMMRNRNLSRAISDIGFYEIRRQLEYKSKLHERNLVIADRFFPSSKLCSCCGCKNEALKLKDREWTCKNCGTVHDRDFNASLNLAKLVIPKAIGESTPAEIGVQTTKISESQPVDEAGILRE